MCMGKPQNVSWIYINMWGFFSYVFQSIHKYMICCRAYFLVDKCGIFITWSWLVVISLCWMNRYMVCPRRVCLDEITSNNQMKYQNTLCFMFICFKYFSWSTNLIHWQNFDITISYMDASGKFQTHKVNSKTLSSSWVWESPVDANQKRLVVGQVLFHILPIIRKLFGKDSWTCIKNVFRKRNNLYASVHFHLALWFFFSFFLKEIHKFLYQAITPFIDLGLLLNLIPESSNFGFHCRSFWF